MLDNIYFFTFNVFVFIVKKTPEFISDAILNLIAFLAYKIDKKHSKIAKVNLDLAFEDKMDDNKKEHIIKECYKNLLFNLRDFVQNQGISKEELLSKIDLKGEEHYLKAKKEGKGVIFITAHYGNWEILSLFLGAKYGEIWGVGRDLDSKRMNEILKKNRNQLNVHTVSKKGALRALLKAISKGSNVGLLVDQNTSEKDGILINFFSKPARHTPAAALLSRKSKIPIVPVFATTTDHKTYAITFYKPIYPTISENAQDDIKNSVQTQADITQKVIEEKPSEWFWLHRRWKNQYEELYR